MLTKAIIECILSVVLSHTGGVDIDVGDQLTYGESRKMEVATLQNTPSGIYARGPEGQTLRFYPIHNVAQLKFGPCGEEGD